MTIAIRIEGDISDWLTVRVLLHPSGEQLDTVEKLELTLKAGEATTGWMHHHDPVRGARWSQRVLVALPPVVELPPPAMCVCGHPESQHLHGGSDGTGCDGFEPCDCMGYEEAPRENP